MRLRLAELERDGHALCFSILACLAAAQLQFDSMTPSPKPQLHGIDNAYSRRFQHRLAKWYIGRMPSVHRDGQHENNPRM